MARNQSSASPYSITGPNPYVWIAWWYKLAAPAAPPHAEVLPLPEREFLRRGKLTSIALLIEFIELGIAMGAVAQYPNPVLLPILLFTAAIFIVATALNRIGKLLPAGVLVILIVEAGMIGSMTPSPGGQLGIAQLPLLCLLAQPLMISVLLFPPKGMLAVGGFNVLVICCALSFLPKTTELQFYLRTQPYAIYSVPIAIQVVCSLISFAVITSLQENMQRADKMEEASRLQQALAEQTSRELEEKRQLETSIDTIVSTLTRFANGDARARVPLGSGNVLYSVAGSVNNLVGRIVRLHE